MIKVSEYGKTLKSFETEAELLAWLTEDYKEQWWINGYKIFAKEINKALESKKEKIFEYAGFEIKREQEEQK